MGTGTYLRFFRPEYNFLFYLDKVMENMETQNRFLSPLKMNHQQVIECNLFSPWYSWTIAHLDKMDYTENWVNAKLEFRITMIYMSSSEGSFVSNLLNIKKNHFLRNVLSNKEHTYLLIILNDTHRCSKFGKLLKVLSSITDMPLYCKLL